MSINVGAAQGLLANLHGRYARATDTRDVDLLRSCFTPDVTWASRGTVETIGRDAVLERFAAVWNRSVLHFVSNIHVTSQYSSPLRGGAYFHLVDMSNGESIAFGRYEDEFVIEGDDARFVARDADYLWRKPGA